MRNQILQAALTAVRTEGPQAFSVRSVAKAAGISTTLVYKHFPKKQDIATALVDEARDVLAGYLLRGLEGESPMARLRRCGEQYVRFFLDRPELYRLLFIEPVLGAAARFPDELESRNTAFLILVDRVRECISAGELAEQDPAVLSLSLWASVHGFCQLCQTGRIPGDELPALWQEAMKNLLRGYKYVDNQ